MTARPARVGGRVATTRDRRFNQTIVGFGDHISIAMGKPHGRLGHYDERTGKIVIAAGQGNVGQQVTLLHELLHCVDAAMLSQKITKRRADHRWIESAAMNLLGLLVLAGFWRGIKRDEFLRFVAQTERRRRRRKP